jgi:ribosomal protein L12E/L44/L45/RPP1/RPP2
MNSKAEQIDGSQERTLSSSARLPGGGAEEDIRKDIYLLMLDLRAKGCTFAQIAEVFNLGGIDMEESEVASMMSQLIFESMLELIRTADERDRACLTCPLRSQNSQQSTESRNPSDVEAARTGEEQKQSATSMPHERQTGRCMPLQPGIEPFKRRERVSESVYEEGWLEHPAIPGLLLSLEERLYGACLEFVDTSGETRKETFKERSFRIKWEKPIPKTVGQTDKDFLDINPELFKHL